MPRKLYGLLFVLALASGLQAQDGPVEPYVVYVAREGEFARCGPSEEYYKTDPLRAGAEVEVYLETEDGWLGIRPPADSFCWLQAGQVEVADDETMGTIIEPSAVAWIGTHLGRARQYRWQVRLDQGEQVTIIGSARREGPDGEELWYRIVPPAGEFRWVQRSQVTDSLDAVVYTEPAREDSTDKRLAAGDDRPPRKDSRRKSSADNRPPSGPSPSGGAEADRSAVAQRNEAADASTAADPVASVIDDAPVGSGLARIDDNVKIRSIDEGNRPGPPSEPSPQGNADWVSGSRVVPASATEPRPAPLQPTTPPSLAPLPNTPAVASRPSGYQMSADLDPADLDSLRLELSHAMAAGAHAGEVDPLRAMVSQLTEQSSDPVVRGRASLLLRRVEEYQRIARQRDGTVRGATDSSTTRSTATAPTIPNRAPLVPDATSPGGPPSTFDGQGWLVRVYSARPNAPPYAITDSAGRTLSYVTPSAGLNLRRYLNQEIGLYGRVAYDTSLETPHLIVEQAVRLRTR